MITKMRNNEYATPLIQITSANDISKQREEDRRRSAIEKFILTGGVVAGAAYGSKKLLTNESISRFFKLSVLDATIKETAGGASWNSLFSDESAIRKPSHLVLEGVRKLEEYSPFRVFRTLQLSHLMTPFVTGKDVAMDVSGDLVASQEKYFANLLESRGEISLESKHLKYGFRLENGKLYEKGADGSLGRLAAKEARLMMPHFALPKDDGNKELIYANKILRHYQEIIGGGVKDQFQKLVGSDISPFTVIAGRDKSQIAYDMFRSYSRVVMEKGVKIWDNPVETIVDLIPHAENAQWHKNFKKFTQVNLGTGGKYRQSVPKTLSLMAKNQNKLIGAVVGYNLLDAAISAMAPEDSAFSKGLLEGGATAAVNTHISFAELWSDNFQEYRDAQEYIAPGSTSLMTMAGLPLAAATAAATASYGTRLYQGAKYGIESSERSAEALLKVFPDKIGNYLPENVANFKATRFKRWGMRAGLVGLALEAPFIPGSLIGDSSENLKETYSGKKDVAIRANRWWFTGSGDYGGDHIKYFDKHWYARMMAGTSTKSKYGDKETKDALNPILHPLDYLRDPYKFEKMHEEDRPYPVWGMDISTGSFLGKAFEKTIGALIKPDVINPRLAEELADVEPGQVIRGDGYGISNKAIGRALDTDTFSVTSPVSEAEASLIEEGKLLAPAAATYDPNREAISWSYEAFKDFIGIKGWLVGVAEDAVDAPTSQIPPQLARSGEATNLGRQIKDANIGGLFGLTEPQRRFIPTSADVTRDRINPLHNNMPSWLPGDEDRFWLNLQEGDPFTKIEHGDSRLPGAGYASLNPILEGVNPEEYPDIFKLKILSDVAMGSDAYYDTRNRIEARESQSGLTDYESEMLYNIRDKEAQRSVKKQFSEYKTEQEMAGTSYIQKAANSYWERLSHNAEKALPSEFLTFFRPAGKLIHQRSAIEDYERTQLEGSDMAIWTKPVSHFIKPAAVAARRLVQDDYISGEVNDRRDIDQYFDTLEYVKQRRIYKDSIDSNDAAGARTAQAAYQKTVEGALTSEINSDQEVLRSYISLPDQEKPYFSSFVNAKNEDRQKILDITPERISDLYRVIWSRKDIMDKSISSGMTAEDANREVKQRVSEEEQLLQAEYSDEYKAWLKMKNKRSTTFREYLADTNAEAYLSSSGGMPGKDFSGWDPRIDMDRIKLRTLTIGNEDFFKFGFWDSDVSELERYTSVLEDEEVNNIAERLRDEQKSRILAQSRIEDSLFREGFEIKKVSVTEGGGDVDINIERT